LILELGTRGSGGPYAEYPDIDLRVNAQGYLHKDGTPNSEPPAGRRTHSARLGRGSKARSAFGAPSYSRSLRRRSAD
jgi:hypothetical protein